METEHDGRTEVEVVTSTQEVFGDSDDSDVEEEEIIQQAPNSEPTGASMKDLFGSDNEDDDDDDSGDAEEPQNQSRSSAALKSRMRDVFGDESEDEATPEEDTPAPSSQLSTQDRDADQTTDMKTILGEDFEDEPPAEKTKTTSQLCLVRAPIFSSKDAHTLVKMPRSISIQDKCFDERTYDASTEAQMFSGASTVIRWRYMKDAQGNVRTDEHGEKLVESNARLVRYSDGSMQLIVGDAAFDTEMRPTQHRSEDKHQLLVF
jgi:RNA polymerase-associated protein LEO1